MKTCSQCSDSKPVTEFYKKKESRDGLTAYCKACKNRKNREWYKANKEKRAESIRKWTEANKEKMIDYRNQWYQENKESQRDRRRKSALDWQKRNRELCNSREAARRAVTKKATPEWANQKYITLWYKLAKIEQSRTNRPVHVDHIIPLNGETVCGLHCEDNMQLLFAEENSSKNNKLLEANY